MSEAYTGTPQRANDADGPVPSADERRSKRHGVNWDTPVPPVPYVHPAGSLEKVLEAIDAGISSHDRFGIVVDADTEPTQRWIQIRDRLKKAGLTAPDEPDRTGTVLSVPQTHKRIGVWLMPDNKEPGLLEHFLAKLVPQGDSCWGFAEEATKHAQELGAPLPEKDTVKGTIYAWLAWRKEPGLPFGTALTARIFGHDSEEARAFVAWFNRVFVER